MSIFINIRSDRSNSLYGTSAILTIVFLCSFLFLPSEATSQSLHSAQFPVIVLGRVEPIDNLPGGISAAEQSAITEAIKDVNSVLRSAEFKNAVLKMHATQSNGYSNEEIYGLMVSRSPLQLNVAVFEGNYKQNHKYHTEGYEEENMPNTCFVNRYYLAGYSDNPGYLASLMLHEAMHVLGFVHYGWGSHKYNSVPYTMNDIYDSIAVKIGVPDAPDDDDFDSARAVATEP